MAPQPSAAPQDSQPKDEPKFTGPHAALLLAIDETPESERSSADRQILRAHALEQERGNLMKKIAANRTYLRLMEETEELDDDQADWLSDFYPEKERGQQRSEDDIERTRKTKAAARK